MSPTTVTPVAYLSPRISPALRGVFGSLRSTMCVVPCQVLTRANFLGVTHTSLGAPAVLKAATGRGFAESETSTTSIWFRAFGASLEGGGSSSEDGGVLS